MVDVFYVAMNIASPNKQTNQPVPTYTHTF